MNYEKDQKLYLCFVGADSDDNRYGVISPIIVDSEVSCPPDTGEFEFLPILDSGPHTQGTIDSRSYADIESRYQKVKLDEILKGAWKQRLEIKSRYWREIFKRLQDQTKLEIDLIIRRLIKTLVINYFDAIEIARAIASSDLKDLEDLSAQMASYIKRCSTHDDPLVDEKRKILSYGDHPCNPHGKAFSNIKKGDVILFIARLVPWIKSQGRFAIWGESTEYNEVVNKLLPYIKQEKLCASNHKLYRDLMYVPYIYDYYFIGYLRVEEVIKLDDILEKHVDPRKAVDEVKELAHGNIKIRENAHYLRFIHAEDPWSEAHWIILGSEDSKLFDKAVRIDDSLVEDLSEHMSDREERRRDCEGKSGYLKKICYLRGSTMVSKEGAQTLREYLKKKEVDLDL